MQKDFRTVIGDKLEVELSSIVVQLGVVGRSRDNECLYQLHAVGHPPPHLVLNQRSTHVETEVLDLFDMVVPLVGIFIIRIENLFNRFVVLSTGIHLPGFIRQEEPAAKSELVLTSTRHHVDNNGTLAVFDIRHTRCNRDFFKDIKVKVCRRRSSIQVRNLDSIHDPVVRRLTLCCKG